MALKRILLFLTAFQMICFGSSGQVHARKKVSHQPPKIIEKKYYLDFFGRRYNLTDNSLGIDKGARTTGKPFAFTFCGRRILDKHVINSLMDPNDPYLTIEESYTTSGDSVNVKSNCHTFQMVLDSIRMKEINFDSIFKVGNANKKYCIYSYRLVSDSAGTEFLINNFDEDSYEFDPRSAESTLHSLLTGKLATSTKVMITDIYYYDTDMKERYRLDFDILLLR